MTETGGRSVSTAIGFRSNEDAAALLKTLQESARYMAPELVTKDYYKRIMSASIVDAPEGVTILKDER